MKKGKRVGIIARVAFLLVVLGLILLFGTPGFENQTLAQAPETCYVDDDKLDCPDADFSTIHDAIDASKYGDTIIACPGNYHETDAVIEAGERWSLRRARSGEYEASSFVNGLFGFIGVYSTGRRGIRLTSRRKAHAF